MMFFFHIIKFLIIHYDKPLHLNFSVGMFLLQMVYVHNPSCLSADLHWVSIMVDT